MAADKFAELVRRLHPGVSVRRLEQRGNLPNGSIAYYLKPSTRIARLPKATTIAKIADALGCSPMEVTQSFAESLDIGWSQELTAEEQELLRVLRRLTPEGQQTLLHLARALVVQHST